MSWNDKSNYEINKAVAIVQRLNLCAGQHYLPKVSYWNTKGHCSMFEPCTNIQDAWPIMKQYNIDIEWPDEGNCCGTVSRYMQGATDVQEDFIDKEEALRCAMIVYLESEGIYPQG